MRFRTADLFAKHGFQDGSMLVDFLTERDFADLDPRDALYAVVAELVVPRLAPAITLRRYRGFHNPVRVDTGEGGSGACRDEVTPTEVEVPEESIVELLTVLRENAADIDLVKRAADAQRRIELRLERYRLRVRLAEVEREFAGVRISP